MITKDILKAKKVLKNEGIVAIPTETVYGLAGNAYSDEALKKIFILKKRPFYNPLIVHIKSASALNQIAQEIPDAAKKLAETFWPGPLTLVLKRLDHISDIVTSGKDTVAVRVPNHPITLKLLDELDFPLAAPSANPFGSISPTSAEHVSNYFETELEVILDGGNCEKGIESTIIGFENNEPILYRHGSIAIEEIEKVIGKVATQTKMEAKPNAPGMLLKHYAPKTETFLTNNISELVKSFEGKKIGVLTFKDKVTNKNIAHQEILSSIGNMNEAAKNLYAALHRLDLLKLDAIIVERLPNHNLGKSINDRLERAVKK
jgi:L-threonylcarbamoyladenylate synthase